MEYGIIFINFFCVLDENRCSKKVFFCIICNHIGLLTRSHSSYLNFISKLDNSDNLFLCFELDFLNNLFV